MPPTCCCPAPDAIWCAALRSGLQVYEVSRDEACECGCHARDEDDDDEG